jgi:hypothetical protein
MRRFVWSRNLEYEEAKARYWAVKIQPQWVVTPGKQTNKQTEDTSSDMSPIKIQSQLIDYCLWGFYSVLVQKLVARSAG